ncbi:hypothetical protein, partial [Kitasatospora sp. NPDC047058]|uniref:hypothetical protein n=1 Tax=Kitasatospora sp. NPDC047058 TaxID=3155620 RepID=UPI0033FEEAB3
MVERVTQDVGPGAGRVAAVFRVPGDGAQPQGGLAGRLQLGPPQIVQPGALGGRQGQVGGELVGVVADAVPGDVPAAGRGVCRGPGGAKFVSLRETQTPQAKVSPLWRTGFS